MINTNNLKFLETGKSSAGVLMKWYDPVNKLYVKSSGYDKKRKKFHYESIAECIASDVATALGVDCVPYTLDTLLWEGKQLLVCVSPDYTSKISLDSRISLSSYIAKAGNVITRRADKYRFLISQLPHIRPALDKMLVFDYLIDNYDRHMRNAELFAYGANINLAPMYDNGSSLLCDWVKEGDLLDLKEDADLFEEVYISAETPSKCFAHQHNTELRLVDKSVFNSLNLGLTKQDFETIVGKYYNHLTPLRAEMVVMLLYSRMKNIVSAAHKGGVK